MQRRMPPTTTAAPSPPRSHTGSQPPRAPTRCSPTPLLSGVERPNAPGETCGGSPIEAFTVPRAPRNVPILSEADAPLQPGGSCRGISRRCDRVHGWDGQQEPPGRHTNGQGLPLWNSNRRTGRRPTQCSIRWAEQQPSDLSSEPRTTARSCSASGSSRERTERWTTSPAQLATSAAGSRRDCLALASARAG
jgi:hypothetical protein